MAMYTYANTYVPTYTIMYIICLYIRTYVRVLGTYIYKVACTPHTYVHILSICTVRIVGLVYKDHPRTSRMWSL